MLDSIPYTDRLQLETYLSEADKFWFLLSVPDSELGLDWSAVLSPLLMIFIAGTFDGGVFPDVGGFEMLVKDSGIRQKGVLKIRIAPAAEST